MGMSEYCLRTIRSQFAPPPPAVLLDFFDNGDGSTIQASHDLAHNLSAPEIAVDFFRFAAAVYCADRLEARPGTWTRSIDLTVPVHDVALWSGASAEIAAALGFLSGDEWRIKPIATTEPEQAFAVVDEPVDTVCLFSGGLDSFTGVLDLLADGKTVCLVAHYEGGQAPSAQTDLVHQLRQRFGEDRIVLRRAFLRPAAAAAGQTRPLPADRETTTRSRSLLLLSAGLLVAAGYGPDVPLHIPENGFIGINVPLTGARSGSLSTRTTHPHFMRVLGECAQQLGITNSIVNPFRLMTKGEVLASCHDRATLTALANRTLSCAHPEAPRYAKRKQGNCGYCFPCLIRRGSMHHVGLDTPADYAFDALREADELRQDRGNDLRALLRSLAHEPRAVDVLRNGPVPAADVAAFADVYKRGRDEILAWLRAADPTPAIKAQLPTA
jgi:7-cyano-7-deazaguanine synthase in queuosine biosynthesis